MTKESIASDPKEIDLIKAHLVGGIPHEKAAAHSTELLLRARTKFLGVASEGAVVWASCLSFFSAFAQGLRVSLQSVPLKQHWEEQPVKYLSSS